MISDGHPFCYRKGKMKPIEYQGSIEQVLCEKATLMNSPINGILELTPLCNMNCDMCFVRLTPNEVMEKGGLRRGADWISLAEKMIRAGTLFVLLTGGEPLLHPDFRDIYLALKQMGMILTINTNGTLIDEAWADFFAQHPPRRINLTLYGKDAADYENLCHYSDGYKRAEKALTLLMERHIDVKVNGSITPGNIESLEELCSIVKSLGTAWKFDTYMYPASRERTVDFDKESRLSPEIAARARVKIMQEKEQDQFVQTASALLAKGSTSAGNEIPLPIQCRAGRSSYVINWQGMMRPCIMLTKPEADVFQKGFSAAWKEITEEVSKIRLNAKCSACTMREVCQSCAACAYSETGAFDGVPEYMCRYTKETLRLLKEQIDQIQEAAHD